MEINKLEAIINEEIKKSGLTLQKQELNKKVYIFGKSLNTDLEKFGMTKGYTFEVLPLKDDTKKQTGYEIDIKHWTFFGGSLVRYLFLEKSLRESTVRASVIKMITYFKELTSNK